MNVALYFLSIIGLVTLLVGTVLFLQANREQRKKRRVEAFKARYPAWSIWYAPLRNRFRVWLADKILGKGWILLQKVWIEQARIGYEKKDYRINFEEAMKTNGTEDT